MQKKLCRIFGNEKKNLPSNKRICWDLLTLIEYTVRTVTPTHIKNMENGLIVMGDLPRKK
jgi:hypothetical protein